MTRPLLTEEQAAFASDGFLIVRDLLTAQETRDLQQWTQDVHDWPADESSPWMPYAEINGRGERVLCRTENFVNSHGGLNGLLRGDKLGGVLRQLCGEEMRLFKEKINYKLAGSGGFAAHVDATAYTHVKRIGHVSVLLAVDASDVGNGGLEVVRGSHRAAAPVAADNCLEPAWVARQHWTPVDLAPGQALIFGSYLAHRSGPNTSDRDRKALYATYNCATEGDLHDAYYAQRREEWPPTHLRRPGDKFDTGALRYGFGSPMLSVDVGHQVVYS